MNTLSHLTLAVGPLGTMEMLIILGIVVLLFGAKKLPELAKGMGKSIREFKKASSEDGDDDAAASDKKVASNRETTKTPDSN